MFPSPSVGPPWLSASPSPAFEPCGIPDDPPPEAEVLVPPDAALVVPPDGALVVPPDEALDCELPPPLLPPPQPAAARTNARIAATPSRRALRILEMLIVCS
jgi:hypothetical protein